MEILIAIGSINAFFFALVIIGKRDRTKADSLLAILFVVLGLSFGLVYFSYILERPVLQLFVWNIGLLIAPLLYLYAYQLTVSGSKKTSITALRSHLDPVIYKSKLLKSKSFASLVLDAFLKPFYKCGTCLEAPNRNIKIKKTFLLNFVPYLASWVYLVLLFVFYSDTEIETLFNSRLKDTDVLFVFFTIIETLSIPVYIILILRLLRKYHKNIKLFFLNYTNDNQRWLRILIITVLLTWLLINSFYYLSNFSNEMGLKYGIGISSIFIFYLGYIVQSKKLFMRK